MAQRMSGGSTSQAAFAQQAQTLREIQRMVMTLSARLDGVEQQQASLATRLNALERGSGAVSKDEVAALRSDVASLRASQGKLRDEIVDDLSKRISALTEKRAAESRKAREAEAARQKSGYNHTVEAGQTLSAIAQAYGVSMNAILKANKLSDPSKLQVGQKLFIPDP